MAGASDQDCFEELERACRARGLPVTVQRRAVFQAIIEHEDHPTADQIYEQIKTQVPGISRTTVYRILDTFVELGLVARICHHGSAARFDPKTCRHHHLVCSYCETIIDLEDDLAIQLKLPDVEAHGFEIDDYHVHFRGVCAACRRKRRGGDNPAPENEEKRATRETVKEQSRSRKKKSKKTR
jgi:Fur family peroxide stress response transcriptional regulator